MTFKIINTDIDMYNNSVLNFRPEAVTELPSTAVEGRIVYLTPERRLYVYTGEEWISTGGKIPTKVSELENDNGYLTEADVGLSDYYTKSEIDGMIGSLTGLELRLVDGLPETGETNVIYLIPSGTSEDRNIKDEYLWIGGAWELIGSTRFEFEFTQDANGVVINGQDLQKATEAQDGLMSKDQVIELHGKQDQLIAGTNIVIDGNTISATDMVRPTYMGKFGGTGGTSFNIVHNLGTYNLLYQIRTTSAPVRYIQAEVSAPNENTLIVNLTNELNSELIINILACDRVVKSTPESTSL